MTDEDRPKLRGGERRRNRWLSRQVNRAVSLTPRQLELIAAWISPTPDESDEDRDKDARSIRRNRAGTVPETLTRLALLALFLLLVLAWVSFQLHHAGAP